MRKITQQAVRAFNNSYKFKSGNTEVRITETSTMLFLHGNMIAEREHGQLFITSAGWETMTTKDRLNGLSGVSIYQKDFQWYLNGKPWDGEWIQI